MNRVSAKIEFCNSTPQEKAVGIARIKVQDSWTELLRSFLREHKETYYKITLEPWGKSPSERSVNLFHEIRDRICEAMGDTTKEHKDHLKRELKAKAGYVKSLNSYTPQEMNQIINVAFLWADEAGADCRDLMPEWRDHE